MRFLLRTHLALEGLKFVGCASRVCRLADAHPYLDAALVCRLMHIHTSSASSHACRLVRMHTCKPSLNARHMRAG
jgi:hypothetical protein